MTENIQIMTVDIALDYPDYTADGLMDIRVTRAESMMDMLHRHMNLIFPYEHREPVDIVVGPRCKPKPMTYATRCKYLTKIGSICRLTRQMPVVVCMGICEDYEPVDSGGGRERG